MNMKNMTRASLLAIFAAALPLASTPASASSVRSKIVRLHVRDDGLHWLIMETTPGGRPPCAANTPYYMIKAEGSAYGASQFAMLMSAYLTGRAVTIGGADACTRWIDGEDISTVSFD